ncbi:hypothetical protein GWI33_023202 [Rhynchophorus ferrugineus]|uniref:Uncharacterized protein n=1 Tax=Rhynchophorus ferrugineus TaxID=354439 RepID=A0A834M2I1_RHYFE|nr:hypothetical protein GWI33_023202 [Rhynchophorus ferrugineus]
MINVTTLRNVSTTSDVNNEIADYNTEENVVHLFRLRGPGNRGRMEGWHVCVARCRRDDGVGWRSGRMVPGRRVMFLIRASYLLRRKSDSINHGGEQAQKTCVRAR